MIRRLLDWFKEQSRKRRESLLFERAVIVTFDESGVTVTWPKGDVISASWDLIDCVAIETNDSGPWGADFWWLLEGRETRCAYPQGATGDLGLLSEFPKRFPGFSDEAVIQANGCTSNARFVCWLRNQAAS